MFRPPSLLSPRSFLPLRILLQGSRGFYVRAYRALLPPHAPDMLTVRIQVIDGTGTFTQSDSQPCRLLTSLSRVSIGGHWWLRSCPLHSIAVLDPDQRVWEALILQLFGRRSIVRLPAST